MAHQPAADVQLRPALGVQRRRGQHQRCLQRSDDRRSLRTVDGALPARRAERHRRSADLPAAEAVQGGLQQPGAEPRCGVEPGQARWLARQAPRPERLSRQLRHELLRRGPDQLPDGRRQRPGPEPDAGAAAVHTRLAQPADAAAAVHEDTDRVRVSDCDVRLYLQSRPRDHRSRHPHAVRPQLDDRLPARDLAATRRSRSATSATAATTCGAATTSTRRTSSRTASSTSSRTRSATSPSTSPTAAPGFANQGLPGQVALPLFDTAFGPRGSVPAVAAGERLHERHVRHAAAAGSGRPAREHARRRLPLPLPDGRQRPARVHVARLQRVGAVPDQRLPGESLRRGPATCGS